MDMELNGPEVTNSTEVCIACLVSYLVWGYF